MALFYLVSLLVWLLILIVVGVLLYVPFAIVWALVVRWRRPRRARFWYLASAPVFGVLFLSALAGAYWHFTSNPVVFESAMGFLPGTGVTNLQTAQEGFADWAETFMTFEADPAIMQRIMGSRSWRPTPAPTGIPPGAPSWWSPPPVPPAHCYVADTSGRNFGHEETYLWHDTYTGQVAYHWSGID